MTGSALNHGLHDWAFSDAREEGGYLRSAGRSKGGGPNRGELLLPLVPTTTGASTIHHRRDVSTATSSFQRRNCCHRCWFSAAPPLTPALPARRDWGCSAYREAVMTTDFLYCYCSCCSHLRLRQSHVPELEGGTLI